MERLLRNNYVSVIVLLSMLFIQACQKEHVFIEDGNTEKYLRTYDLPNTSFSEILVDNNGEASIIGVDTGRNMQVATLNSQGFLKELSFAAFDKTDYYSGSYLIGTKMHDDKWILIDRDAPQFLVVNNKGVILSQEVFVWHLTNYPSLTGKAFVGNDDIVSIATTINGYYSAITSYPIFDFDLKNNKREMFNIPINRFNARDQYKLFDGIHVYFRDNTSHYLIGSMIPNESEINRYQVFLGKWNRQSRSFDDFKIIDYYEQAINNLVTDLYCDGDGNTVALISSVPNSTRPNSITKAFAVTRINSAFETAWFTSVEFDNTFAIWPKRIYKINEGLLIVGSCDQVDEVGSFPFMVVLDDKGEVVSKKIFNMRNSWLVTATQLPDDNLLLFGYSNQFGKNVSGVQQISIKCSIDGNFID